MTLLEAGALGIVQGITEFLPISSSGHLLMAQTLFGLHDLVALKSFDIAVHFGTLLAILIYFRKDYLELLAAVWAKILKKGTTLAKEDEKNFQLGLTLILATIPAVLVGLLFGDIIDGVFYNAISVPVLLILVSFIFLWAEYQYKKNQQVTEEISRKNGLIIGLAQVCALIPGVSRSGATISASLLMGINRAKAARFSFLLGSVAMMAATAYAVLKVVKGDYLMPATDILIVGTLTSFVAGWFSISFLMNYLKKHTLAIFAYYRIIAGLAFLIALYLILGSLAASLSSF